MRSTGEASLLSNENIHQFLAKDVDTYFTDMYMLFQQHIRNYIAHEPGMAKSNEAIEDCAQETFKRAFKALKRRSPEDILKLDHFKGWLIAIAKNVVLSWHDKNRSHFETSLPGTGARLKLYVESIELESSGSSEQRLDIPDGDEQKQPEKALMWKEKLAELREYVYMLPEQYRIAIQLQYFDELKLDQIAILQKKTLSAVKTHVRRGIQMLSDYFMVVQALEEMKEDVLTYILLIPSSCGTVMKLHFLEGMKLPDVAIRCNYAENKVKRLLYHGTNIVATHLRAKDEKGK